MAEPEEPGTTVSWETLPSKPLRLIASRLPLVDFVKFRLVCKAWKQTIKQCYHPYLVVTYTNNLHPPVLFSARDFQSTIMLSRPPQVRLWDGVRFVGSSHGWLIASKAIPFRRYLMNIFTEVVIILPKWDPSTGYTQPYLSAAPTSTDCTVLLIGESLPGFAFCKPGDTKWTRGRCKYPLFSENENQDFLDQAVSVEGRFYVLSHQGRLAIIDDLDQREDITLLTAESLRPWETVEGYQKYLVESKGEILVVFLCSSISELGPVDHVEVFRFDHDTSSWTRVYDLGDRVFCVGKGCSFSISALKVGCRGNRILFADKGRRMWVTFGMEEQSIEPTWYVGILPLPCDDRIWLLPTFD